MLYKVWEELSHCEQRDTFHSNANVRYLLVDDVIFNIDIMVVRIKLIPHHKNTKTHFMNDIGMCACAWQKNLNGKKLLAKIFN